MKITTGLIAKIGGSLIVLSGGAVGVYFVHDYLNNNLSQYDTALIDFLEKGNGKNNIIFEVKKGEDGAADLTVSDISLSDSNSSPITATVKITTSSSNSNNTFKVNGNNASDSDLKEIKQLGQNNNGWTWECSFKFEVEGNDTNGKSVKDEYKDRIFKDTDLGLLGLLKKDLSNYTNPTDSDKTSKWTKEEIIQTKIDFIKKCGWARGLTKNRKLNKEKVADNEIKVSNISIKFKVEENNLVPKDESFNYWFIRNEDKDKTYSTTSGS